MLNNILVELFERNLNKLKEEISLYKDETKLWVAEKGINNSAGNLALHIIGNLNHFIGSILGNTGYVRNREAEFSDKNVSYSEIINKIDQTIETIKSTLNELSDEDLQKDYPLEVFKNKGTMNTAFFLIHLTGHLNYHLGQINYHRRLI